MRTGELNLDPAKDRVMLCGSQSMLHDVAAALDDLGFQASPNQGTPGDYVIERALCRAIRQPLKQTPTLLLKCD